MQKKFVPRPTTSIGLNRHLVSYSRIQRNALHLVEPKGCYLLWAAETGKNYYGRLLLNSKGKTPETKRWKEQQEHFHTWLLFAPVDLSKQHFHAFEDIEKCLNWSVVPKDEASGEHFECSFLFKRKKRFSTKKNQNFQFKVLINI